MLTLHAVTRGFRNGTYQHYPTPDIKPRPVDTERAAEETAVRLLQAYHSICYLRLVDDTDTEVREYGRHDFFYAKSPLREVRRRVVDQDIAARLAARTTEK